MVHGSQRRSPSTSITLSKKSIHSVVSEHLYALLPAGLVRNTETDIPGGALWLTVANAGGASSMSWVTNPLPESLLMGKLLVLYFFQIKKLRLISVKITAKFTQFIWQSRLV